LINAQTSVEAYTRPYANLNKTGTRLVRLKRQARHIEKKQKSFYSQKQSSNVINVSKYQIKVHINA